MEDPYTVGRIEEASPWEEARQARKAGDSKHQASLTGKSTRQRICRFCTWCPERRKERRETQQSEQAEAADSSEVWIIATCAELNAVFFQKDCDSKASRSQIVESKDVKCEEAIEAALWGIDNRAQSGR